MSTVNTVNQYPGTVDASEMIACARAMRYICAG